MPYEEEGKWAENIVKKAAEHLNKVKNLNISIDYIHADIRYAGFHGVDARIWFPTGPKKQFSMPGASCPIWFGEYWFYSKQFEKLLNDTHWEALQEVYNHTPNKLPDEDKKAIIRVAYILYLKAMAELGKPIVDIRGILN